MILRMSSLFVRTLREDPADAEVPSHRLLVRAGYIRRAAPGIYTWLPLGLRVLRKIEDIIREEMDAIGAQELLVPRAAAPRALRGDRPLDRVRRRHLPAQGPQGRRLPARPHARGDVHPRGEGPLLVLQGPAAVDLPDPDQVPRRGAAPRRAAARPRVRDEGLLLLRRRRRRARRAATRRTATPTSGSSTGSASSTSSSRRCPARWAARSPRSSWPRPRSARTPTSAARAATTPPTSRPSQVPRARARAVRRRARRARRADARTPRRSTRWSTTSTRSSRATDRPWTAADTLKNVARSSLTHPDGTREAARDRPARRPRGRPKRLEAPARRGRRGRALRRGRLRRAPRAGQGLHRPRRAGREEAPPAIRYLVDPRVVEGTRWVTGADVDGSHVLDLVAGRDFTADGTIEAAEVRDGDPCPDCDDGGVLESARGIEMGHIFQLGRKYADALGLKVLDENGKLVTVTMGSYGIGPSRAVAAIAEGTLDELGLCLAARGRAGRRAPGRRRQGRGASSRPPSGSPTSCRRQGVEVLYDDRPAR